MSYSTWQKYTPPRACIYGARATSSPGAGAINLQVRPGQDGCQIKNGGSKAVGGWPKMYNNYTVEFFTSDQGFHM